MKLTFSSKFGFECLLLFEVLKYFDHTVAFSDCIPITIFIIIIMIMYQTTGDLQ